MKYTIKLAEADIINKNNRCYSKEVFEKINEQLNSNTVNVYNQKFGGKPNPPIDAVIGQTIKLSSRIIDNALFVDVNLIKPKNANFINLCCTCNINLSNKAKMSYDGNIKTGFHEEIEDVDVQHLFADNTNSYYDESNIISKNKMEIE